MSNVASLFLLLTTGPSGSAGKKIVGEATDAEYRGQIEIHGWNWNLTRSSESSRAAKAGAQMLPPANSVVPSVLTFDKPMCRATSGMLAAMRTGELLSAVFSLEEDSTPDFLLQLTLEGVRILEYELDIEGAEVKESWKLNYDSIRFDYAPDYKEGKLTVSLERHAGASTDSPANQGPEEKIVALAAKLDAAKLGPLLKRLEADMSKPGVPKKESPKPDGKGKG